MMQVKSELVSSLVKQFGQRLLISRAAIHLSSFNQLKKIEKTQDPKTNTTIIEGKYIETDKSKVINFNSNTSEPLRPCAFCELEKRNIYVQHTDVLILRQFLVIFCFIYYDNLSFKNTVFLINIKTER